MSTMSVWIEESSPPVLHERSDRPCPACGQRWRRQMSAPEMPDPHLQMAADFNARLAP